MKHESLVSNKLIRVKLPQSKDYEVDDFEPKLFFICCDKGLTLEMSASFFFLRW